MSGSTTKAKYYLVKCLQTKQPISFVKDAAKDLASYSVRFSSAFTSDMKSEFLSLLDKIYYKTSRFYFYFRLLVFKPIFCLTL